MPKRRPRRPGARLACSFFVLPLVAALASAEPSRSEALPGAWRALGPDGGPVNSIAIDPVNPLVVFAVADAGLFRSSDGGATWNPAVSPPVKAFVSSFAIHPSSSTILYAGTAGGGAYKSTDGGTSWRLSGLSGKSVSFVGIPRNAPASVFAVEAANLWKSTDAGLTWARLRSISAPRIAFDPSGRIVMAGAYDGTVIRSADGGASWSESKIPGSNSIATMAISPANPALVLAGMSGSGVYRSTDGGTTWSLARTGLPDGYVCIGTVAFDPLAASRVVITLTGPEGAGVAVSDDSGSTWRLVFSGVPALCEDPSALAIDPIQPSTWYTSAGGHDLSKTSDSGVTWTAVNRGIHAQRVLSVAFEPGGSAAVYAGTANGEIHQSLDGGRNWKRIVSRSGPVTGIAVSPFDRSLIFAVRNYTLFRSRDRGATWEQPPPDPFGPPSLAVSNVVIDPQNASAILVASYYGLYRSTDAGQKWRPMFGYGLVSMAFDPAKPRTYYALKDYIYKSEDAGETWEILFGYAGMSAIAPAKEPAMLVGYGDGILDQCGYDGSYNHCWQGTDYRPGMAVKTLLQDPVTPGVFYAGFGDDTSGQGMLLRSTDGGFHWTDFGSSPESLVNREIFTLAAKPGKIYAGALGGLFETDAQRCDRCPGILPFR